MSRQNTSWCRGSLAWLGRQTHNHKWQTMIPNGDGTFMLDGGETQLVISADEVISYFREWLTKKELSKEVIYEYCRVAKHFLDYTEGTEFGSQPFFEKLDEFMKIENPDTFRNTLAGLKKFMALVSRSEYMAKYKYRQVLPTFDIEVKTLEQMRDFGKAIQNRKVKIYYVLGCVSAIRPEHLLRLYKSLFDRTNNMIKTWQKVYGRKNFFFSYYTDEIKPLIEAYLDELPTDDSKLFPIGYRFIQDEFERASKRSGIKVTPKDMRKFATNWLRRHGLIQDDVDVLTSHVPKNRIVILHYLDHSRLQTDYRKATEQLKIL